MIAKAGIATHFAKPALPFADVAKPPVAVIVKPQLPPAVLPREVRKPAADRPVIVEMADRLSARCRILLNEAQREIDRLRRSMAASHAPPAAPREIAAPCDSPASPPAQRKIYAVDPIGQPPPPREDPPPTVPGPKIVKRPHVTNVGSLLDVLI